MMKKIFFIRIFVLFTVLSMSLFIFNIDINAKEIENNTYQEL